MSRQLIDRSPDLLRLQKEGYDIAVVEGYLLVRQIPYVNASKEVNRGILICKLDLSGDRTDKPHAHDVYWQGDPPCHHNGSQIDTIINSISNTDLGNGIVANARFSARADYRDYYHKVNAYVGRLWGEAQEIDPSVTPRVFPAIPDDDDESVFKYIDTATSRADIGKVSEKLTGLRIGIVGLGGTGSYILDLVAKTWVAEIHLIDGDIFSQHNAFRTPGAPTIDDLAEKPFKVDYLTSIYSNMRRGIIPHPEYLTSSNLNLLDGLDFIFICIDKAEIKQAVVERLNTNNTSFIEVGMGTLLESDKIGGIVRTVVSDPENREKAASHISYDDSNPNNVYTTNIQIADLNALNAAIAVMQWKKRYGFYQDTRKAHVIGVVIASGETIIEGTQ